MTDESFNPVIWAVQKNIGKHTKKFSIFLSRFHLEINNKE